ncbi:MAG: biotin/lipoyl-binding protein [Clostridia bacterium]|nr:biotin/lipoyl-binding protein [Clostridia bacterium]
MRKFIINVNGKSYDVEVEEVGAVASAAPVQAAAPVAAPSAPAVAPAAAPAANVAGTKAESPMPGTILKVNVNVGDTVTEGQAIMVLEAMKMENEIPAPVSGKVVSVNVKQGDAVETGTVLAVIG